VLRVLVVLRVPEVREHLRHLEDVTDRLEVLELASSSGGFGTNRGAHDLPPGYAVTKRGIARTFGTNQTGHHLG
jgi:hypothetical protein